MKRKGKAEREIDKEIEREYYRQGNGVQIPIMTIPKIYQEAWIGVINGVPIADSIAASIKAYRVN